MTPTPKPCSVRPITIGSRDIDIIEYMSSRMQVAECEVVEVNKAIGNVTITHVYVDLKSRSSSPTASSSPLKDASSRASRSRKSLLSGSWTTARPMPALFVPSSWTTRLTKSGPASKSARRIWKPSRMPRSQLQNGSYTATSPASGPRRSASSSTFWKSIPSSPSPSTTSPNM